MNLVETLEVLRELKRVGATHFRSDDFEVTLSSDGEKVSIKPEPTPEVVQNDEATGKLKDLIETLKMNDQELVDKIFPAGAGI